MELGDQLADGVLAGRDLKELAFLAQLIVKHRADEQRRESGI
jgi:hypothetical protein